MNSRDLSTIDLGNSLVIDLISCHAMILIKSCLFSPFCGVEKQLEVIHLKSSEEGGCPEISEKMM